MIYFELIPALSQICGAKSTVSILTMYFETVDISRKAHLRRDFSRMLWQ